MSAFARWVTAFPAFNTRMCNKWQWSWWECICCPVLLVSDAVCSHFCISQRKHDLDKRLGTCLTSSCSFPPFLRPLCYARKVSTAYIFSSHSEKSDCPGALVVSRFNYTFIRKVRQPSLVTSESSSIQTAFWRSSFYVSGFVWPILLFESFIFKDPTSKANVKVIEYHLVWLNLFVLFWSKFKCLQFLSCFNFDPISCCGSPANVSLMEIFAFYCFGYTGDKIVQLSSTSFGFLNLVVTAESLESTKGWWFFPGSPLSSEAS